MRIASFIVAWILLVGTILQVNAQSALPLQMDVDHASFAYDEDHSLLEVYMAFGVASLSFEREDEHFAARLPLELAVVRDTDTTLAGTPQDPVWQDSVSLSFSLSDTADVTPEQFFLYQLRAPVRPGEYELRVVVPEDDARARQSLELRRQVRVPDYTQSDLVGLSDITLATSIERGGDRDDRFYKNGLIIRPNANQVFGRGLSHLFYYVEAYHADEIATAGDRYTLFTYVAGVNRSQPLPDLQRREQREARSPDVLVGSFNVEELPTGPYFLHVALLNEDNEAVVEQSRKFFVYNPGVERNERVASPLSFESSPFAGMPEEEVDEALAHIEVIATDAELQRIDNLGELDEKRRFLMSFWQKRDPEPSTPVNEYRDAFYRRVQYANDRYTNAYDDGWETDRGRVYIEYGTPGQVEPRLYERDMLPHEIWEYNNIPGEGQAIFVFADQEGFGDFRLLHSSVAGEPKMPNWQSRLRR